MMMIVESSSLAMLFKVLFYGLFQVAVIASICRLLSLNVSFSSAFTIYLLLNESSTLLNSLVRLIVGHFQTGWPLLLLHQHIRVHVSNWWVETHDYLMHANHVLRPTGRSTIHPSDDLNASSLLMLIDA